MGTLVRPETVTVGEHFTATVHVRAPLGATVTFPEATDSAQSIDTAAAPRRSDAPSSAYVDATMTYALAAWETGRKALGLGDVVVHTAAGDQHVSLAHLSVFVRSVLPADTALRKPKPARPLIPVPGAFPRRWLWWAAAVLVALLLATLVWWLRRRRRTALAEEDQLAWAEREFDRVEALRLLDQSATEQYAILMAGVLRRYLVRQFAVIRSSATTRELAGPLHREPIIPADRVLTLFERIDLLKFAHAAISLPEAQGVAAESRALVRETARRRQAELDAQHAAAQGASGTGAQERAA